MDTDVAARRLNEERAELRERLAAMSSELDAVAAAVAGSNLDDEHDPEGSTVAFEREQLAALRARARDALDEVDAALHRVREGSYGVCANCGSPIADERLAALPATQLCIRCAAGRT